MVVHSHFRMQIVSASEILHHLTDIRSVAFAGGCADWLLAGVRIGCRRVR